MLNTHMAILCFVISGLAAGLALELASGIPLAVSVIAFGVGLLYIVNIIAIIVARAGRHN